MTDFDLNQGALAPVADEVDLTAGIAIDGHLPDALDGILIRNGPNPHDGRFSGRTMADWWTAPGMLHGLAISGGRVDWYRNRWTRPPTGNNNVNVIGFGGRILALGEGGPPLEVDRNLATTGHTFFGGALTNGMMAHPKVDPSTGELRFFRADWQPPYLQVGSIDPANNLTGHREVTLDKPMMMHDFAITPRFDVVLDLNVGLDPSLLELGVPLPIRWHDDHRARIGLIPRDGSAPRWFGIEPCFIQHVVNAHEIDGHRSQPPDPRRSAPRPQLDTGRPSAGRVVLDAVRYPRFLEFDEATSCHLPNPLGVLWRYELDLDSGTVAERQLDDRHIELPRIDERRTGRRHSVLYSVEQPNDREMRGLRRYDLDADTSENFHVEPGDQNSEAVFVPAGPGETDGWLLCCTHRAPTDTTDVVVIDANALTAPPLATIRLPRRIPAGFHGAWIPPVE